MRKYFVYLHFVKDSSHPFYVGAASNKERAYNFSARSGDWHKVYQRADQQIRVELHEVNSKTEANLLEIKYIKKFKEHLVNKENSKPLPTTELLNSELQRIPSELGTTIRILRIKQGYSTKQLSKLAGISTPTLNKIERGECRSTMTAYINLLYILGVVEELATVGYSLSKEDRASIKARNTKGYNLYEGKTKKEYLDLL